jgi:hypothetical protein
MRSYALKKLLGPLYAPEYFPAQVSLNSAPAICVDTALSSISAATATPHFSALHQRKYQALSIK